MMNEHLNFIVMRNIYLKYHVGKFVVCFLFHTDANLLGECLLHVRQDTGVRYAKATADWNPHHLFPWTAKLMGFRAPIAHGMWTLARTLDELFGNGNKSQCLHALKLSVSPVQNVFCSMWYFFLLF